MNSLLLVLTHIIRDSSITKLRTSLKTIFVLTSLLKKWRESKVVYFFNTKLIGIEGIKLSEKVYLGERTVLCTSHYEKMDHTRTISKKTIEIGASTRIDTGCILASYGGNISIGKNVSINPYCILYGHGGLKIGNNTRVAARCTMIPANHGIKKSTLITDQKLTKKGITIGEDCWIGTGASILDGVTLGDQCVVGAGSVVTKSFPDGTIVAGIPAKKISNRV